MKTTRNRSLVKKGITAAKKGNYKYLQKLIQEQGLDVNKTNDDAESTLFWAVDRRRIKCINLLIESGADVNFADFHGNTLLFIATYNEHKDVVRILLKAGADANKANLDGKTPVMKAADLHTLQLLVAAGGDINVKPRYGWSALLLAAYRCQFDFLEFLVHAGADVNISCTFEDVTALFLVSEHRKQIDETIAAKCMKLLITAGADVNKPDIDGWTALMVAAKLDHSKCIEVLLQAGADVNAVAEDGYTALLAAAHYDNKDSVELLIKAGAHVNYESDEWGETALFHATAGHSWSYTTANGTTVSLSGRVMDESDLPNNTECTKLLIEAGANVNHINHRGCTALMNAASRGNYSCVKLLLKSGARINVENDNGFKAVELIDVLVSQDGEKVMTLLYSAGEIFSDEIIQNFLTRQVRPLQIFCRYAIRKHLLNLDPHSHLFGRVPQLGLPFILRNFLLYYETLEESST